MKAQLERKIFGDFPELYADTAKSSMEASICWGLECLNGWYDLIYDLSSRLSDEIGKLPSNERENYRVVQLKEKFGLLRVYLTQETDIMSAIIDDAERKSGTICEECGDDKTAKLRNRRGWLLVRCDKCWEGDKRG